MEFKTWLEYSDINLDLFGFDNQDHIEKNIDVDEDELPIRPFGISWLVDRLASKKLAGIDAKTPFNSIVTWGSKEGSVRIRITPNSSVMIERKIYDLSGNDVWYLNKLFKINMKQFTGYEDSVANEIFDQVYNIYSNNLESPSRDFGELRSLVKLMAGRLRAVSGDSFLYQEIKEVNKQEYVIVFSMAATGVGKLLGSKSSGQTPQAMVDVSYSRHTGMIRVIFSTVSSEQKSISWEIDVPYFDALFTPAQDQDLIINSVATTMKYF